MIDRRARILAIADTLELGAAVTLQGAPGSGKTYIGRAVMAVLEERGCPTVLLNAREFDSAADLLATILAVVTDGVGEGDRAVLSDSIQRDLSRTSGKGIAVLLDDVDAVLQMPDAHDLFIRLAVLRDDADKYQFGLMLLSRRSLMGLEVRVRGISRLALRCHPHYVLPVQLQDLADGSWESTVNLVERDALLRSCGGHPILLTDALRMGGVVPSEAGATIVFRRLIGYLRDLDLLSACIQIVCGPRTDRLYWQGKDLAYLGFSDAGAQSDCVLFTSSSWFLDMLANEARDLSPWGELGRAEKVVRRLIESELEIKYGEGWLEPLLQVPAISLAHVGAVRRMEAESKTVGSNASWLHYTYPRDLWVIVKEEWSVFSKVFSAADLPHWRERFEGLATYRTPVAHNREHLLSPDQRIQCARWASDIVRAVTQARPAVVLD